MSFCCLVVLPLMLSRVGKASLVVVSTGGLHLALSTSVFQVCVGDRQETVHRRSYSSSVAVGRAFLTLASRLVRRHFSPPSLILSSTKKELTKKMSWVSIFEFVCVRLRLCRFCFSSKVFASHGRIAHTTSHVLSSLFLPYSSQSGWGGGPLH